MSGLVSAWRTRHLHTHVVVVLVCLRRRLLLRRRWYDVRCLLADRELHGRDLLHLVDDDFLGDAPQLLILPVAQLGDRHVDRPLMMRHHHCCEIAIDIAARLDRHIVHHPGHRIIVFLQERRLVCDGSRRHGRTGFLRKQVRRKGKRDKNARAKNKRA
jgi:hypothetical protein